MFSRVLCSRSGVALALLLACSGLRAQELVERWFTDCAAVARRSARLQEWLQERGTEQAPRACFLLDRGEMLFLESFAMGSDNGSLSHIDLRRKDAQPQQLWWGDDEVLKEFGAINGKHYALLRAASMRGGVEAYGYSLVYLVPRRAGQPPFRVVSLHSGSFRPCEGGGRSKSCPEAGEHQVFSNGAADILEVTLPEQTALLGEPRLVMEAGKVSAVEFPTRFGGPPLQYRITQGSLDFAAVDLDGFAARVKRQFPAATVRPKQPS
jgi:hypothetical protein